MGLVDNTQHNLVLKYYEPFKVLELILTVAYKLALPVQACIHNAFHMVLLKKFQGQMTTTLAPLPPPPPNQKWALVATARKDFASPP